MVIFRDSRLASMMMMFNAVEFIVYDRPKYWIYGCHQLYALDPTVDTNNKKIIDIIKYIH